MNIILHFLFNIFSHRIVLKLCRWGLGSHTTNCSPTISWYPKVFAVLPQGTSEFTFKRRRRIHRPYFHTNITIKVFYKRHNFRQFFINFCQQFCLRTQRFVLHSFQTLALLEFSQTGPGTADNKMIILIFFLQIFLAKIVCHIFFF